MDTAPRIDYRTKEATEADIRLHLTVCAPDFTPPLNERVDIPAYAKKLAEKAVSFEAWQDGRLAGLIAAYVNGDKASAFITSVSVEKAFMGSGVAAELLRRCIAFSAAAGITQIGLEVDRNNAKAIRFYRKFSFTATHSNDESLFMNLEINNHQ